MRKKEQHDQVEIFKCVFPIVVSPLAQMLIDFGADINSIYRMPGNVVQTPLDCALGKGFRSTAKYLQLHGGLPANKLRLSGRNPNALNDQELVTPLSFSDAKRSDVGESRKTTRNVVLYVNQSDSDTNDAGSLEIDRNPEREMQSIN